VSCVKLAFLKAKAREEARVALRKQSSVASTGSTSEIESTVKENPKKRPLIGEE